MIKKKGFISIIIIALILFCIVLGIYLIKKSNINEFKKAISSNNYEVIVLGKNKCSWCDKFSPILKEVDEEYKIKYVYVKIDTLLNNDYNYLIETLKIDELATPTTYIVKSGEIVDTLIGYVDKEKLVKFLNDNKIIESN